jgi:hypothetical protein
VNGGYANIGCSATEVAQKPASRKTLRRATATWNWLFLIPVGGRTL